MLWLLEKRFYSYDFITFPANKRLRYRIFYLNSFFVCPISTLLSSFDFLNYFFFASFNPIVNWLSIVHLSICVPIPWLCIKYMQRKWSYLTSCFECVKRRIYAFNYYYFNLTILQKNTEWFFKYFDKYGSKMVKLLEARKLWDCK